MKLDRQPDGSLVIRENPAVLRGILICLGATVLAAVALRTGAGDLRLSDRRYADERETSEIADAVRAVLNMPSRAPVEDGIERLRARRPNHP